MDIPIGWSCCWFLSLAVRTPTVAWPLPSATGVLLSRYSRISFVTIPFGMFAIHLLSSLHFYGPF